MQFIECCSPVLSGGGDRRFLCPLLSSLGLAILALFCAASPSNAQNCQNLLPQGSNQDDGVVITNCLKTNATVLLAPNTASPVTFLLKTPIKIDGGTDGGMARQLIGKSGLVTLKASFSCPIVGTNPWVEEPAGGGVKWTPAIEFGSVSGVLIRDVTVDVTNLGYDCDFRTSAGQPLQKLLGSSMVRVSLSPYSRIEGVKVVGTKFDAPPVDSRGPGGANCGGIEVARSANSVVRGCTVQDVGFYQEHNDTGTSTEAFLVKNSRNALIDSNVGLRTAFGITVWNTPMSMDDNQYSCTGTTVANNNITGISTSNCSLVDFCGQGRGIKILNCDGDSMMDDGRIIRYLTITGNQVQGFGNNGTGEFPPGSTGSGISVDCGCQKSTFTSNNVQATDNSQATILFRSTATGDPGTTPIYPSLLNTFYKNTFSTTGSSGLHVKFFANGFDQIGLGRIYNAASPNQNTYTQARVGYDTTFGFRCNGHARAEFEIPQTGQINGGVVNQGTSITLRASNVWGGHTATFKFFACGTFDGCPLDLPQTPPPQATASFQIGTSSGSGCLTGSQSFNTNALPTGIYQVFGTWYDSATLITVTDVPIGQLRVIPANQTLAADTIGTFITASNGWFLKNTFTSGAADITFGYGTGATAVPVSGDWDGNGTKTPGVYDTASSTFYLRNTNTAGPADIVVPFGAAGTAYKPIVGDWDGDGMDTVGLYLPATGTFFVKYKNTGGDADTAFNFGPANAIPVIGDWDGNRWDSIGVYVPSTGAWFLRNSNSAGAADISFIYGAAGSTPLSGDWNGDGLTTIGTYVPATSTFFLKNINAAGAADYVFSFGAPNSTPIAGNWDGN